MTSIDSVRAVPDDVPGGHGQPEGAVAEGRGVPVGALPAGAGEEAEPELAAALAVQLDRGVGAEVLPRARRVVVGDGDLIAFRAVGAGPHVGREDVAVDDSLPVIGPVDGEVDASRMVVGLEEGDVAPPASEGLEVLDPGADVDQAREPARVEAGAAGSEDGRPLEGPPSRIERLVETDLPDDRRCGVAIRRDLAFRVERVHLDLAAGIGFPPGKRHSLRCRCHSSLKVQPISWPGLTTCPSSTTGWTCPYVKWPIRTMPSTPGGGCLHTRHTSPPSSA